MKEKLKLLEKTAKEYGATTVFSASEAAQALKYMALAGWDAETATSALGGVLDLAAASGMELAQASDMVTDYLSAFGLAADKSTYFADMLAYAQSNSNTSAEQLGEAYKNSAANMKAAGQDVETTTALLAQMANQGLTRDQITQLGSMSGISADMQGEILNHFTEIDTNHDGKVTAGEIQAYNLTSKMEQRKVEDENRMIKSSSIFYANEDKEFSSSLLSYKWLQDD